MTRCAPCSARTRSGPSGGLTSCAPPTASASVPPRRSCSGTWSSTGTGRGILLRLRALQAETGGFTEFVPLPFVHMEAPIYLKGRCAAWSDLPRNHPDARRGPARAPSAHHTISRRPGSKWARRASKACLSAGANDLGGTLMDETIHAFGGRRARPGNAAVPDGGGHLLAWTGSRGQRTTLYATASEERYRASFGQWRRATVDADAQTLSLTG